MNDFQIKVISHFSEMNKTLLQELNQLSFPRKALVLDPVSEYKIPTYEIQDTQSDACLCTGINSAEKRVFGDRIKVHPFELEVSVTISDGDDFDRKLSRAVQQARQELQAKEMQCFLSCLNLISKEPETRNTRSRTVEIPKDFLKRDFLEIKVLIDQWDLVTQKFLMPIERFNRFLEIFRGDTDSIRSTAKYPEFDPSTQRSTLLTGHYGNLWGAEVHVSKLAPKDTIIAFADSEHLGVMPIISNPAFVSCEEVKRFSLDEPVTYVLKVRETIGMAILNKNAVSFGICKEEQAEQPEPIKPEVQSAVEFLQSLNGEEFEKLKSIMKLIDNVSGKDFEHIKKLIQENKDTE